MKYFDESRTIAYQSARIVHRRYKNYFDLSDVVQELMVWILSHEDKINEWLDHPPTTQEYKDGAKKLSKSLSRYADRICRKMKAQKLGYETRDEHFYTGPMLEDLLPMAYRDVIESHDASKPKISGGGNPAEGGNYVAQLVDVRRAVDKLDPMDQLVLRMKFYEQLPLREIAEFMGISVSTCHRRCSGALYRLSVKLGGSNPYGRDE